MQPVKETVSNVAASAKSGMEKTKATLQEKAEKTTTRDPLHKEMATEKKDERKIQAELNKQQAREQNAAARQVASAGGPATYTTGPTDFMTAGTGTGTGTGHPIGAHQMSAVPGHGTGQPTGGHVTEGVVGSEPIGTTGTGMGGTTAPNINTPGYGAGTGRT